MILQKGSFFGEEYIFADERCLAGRPAFAASMDKLVAREINFRFSCKSLDGLLMSLSIDEFIRILNKEDNTLTRLRNQFIAKTKIKTDKILEDEDSSDEDLDASFLGGKKKDDKSAAKIGEQIANPIKEFR